MAATAEPMTRRHGNIKAVITRLLQKFAIGSSAHLDGCDDRPQPLKPALVTLKEPKSTVRLVPATAQRIYAAIILLMFDGGNQAAGLVALVRVAAAGVVSLR